MKEAKRIFITDCEGPISKNDNAFELASRFIPEGDRLFTQISKYDDVLADIIKREGYKAGDTLKLIVPFLKAYGVTNRKMIEFSAQNILLMQGAKDMLQLLKNLMPSFIVSTTYEHYVKALCRAIDFPYQNTYCTHVNIDAYALSEDEKEKLENFSREICTTPLIEIPERAKSLEDFSERTRETIERLDNIFWEEIAHMKLGAMFTEINPIGGVEKARAARKIVAENGSDLKNVVYVGDSITDVECFRLVKENDGLTVSFNGNPYAIREAEIAILSTNAIVAAVIAEVFNRFGKDTVYDLVENWEYACLKKHNINQRLQEKVKETFPRKLPKISRITKNNAEELAAESTAFRRLVRGEKVGRLG